MAYKVHARMVIGNACLRVVETQSRLQALFTVVKGFDLPVEPALVAMFRAWVANAGFSIVPMHGRHRTEIRFGLLCWRADVVPAGKKWPTSRGK